MNSIPQGIRNSLIILALALIFYPRDQKAPKKTQPCKLLRCHDGDSCWMESADKKKFYSRFVGIDAPELSQKYGKKSLQALQAMLHKKKLHCEFYGKDRYKRDLILVREIKSETSINESMIRKGHAWHYPLSRYKGWKLHQIVAQSQKLGLWENNQPVMPWKFRKKDRKASSRKLPETPPLKTK